MSLREIYDLLANEDNAKSLERKGGKGTGECYGNPNLPAPGTADGGEPIPAEILEKQWTDAIQSAAMEHKMAGNGISPGLSKILSDIGKPKVNWKSVLRKYLSVKPMKYGGYDRRFIHRNIRGLKYVDSRVGKQIRIKIYLDTSLSCWGQIEEMMPEVAGIAQSYQHVTGEVNYFDSAIYGPYRIEDWQDARPNGGGGTLWGPIEADLNRKSDDVFSVSSISKEIVIIITDGYFYDLPAAPHDFGVPRDYLFVLVRGAAENSTIPFGDKIRLSD
jgi:predicted metal-dependent peptidase